MVALGGALAYGAALEALPSLTDGLVVPTATGLGVAILIGAVLARRLGAGTVGLLVATWIVVLGWVTWMPPDSTMPLVASPEIVDWLLVHSSWATPLGTVVALACLLVARRFEGALWRRAGLTMLAVWLAAHSAHGAIARAGAIWGSPPWAEAVVSLTAYATAAAVVATIARRALAAVRSSASVPAAWIPCALVLALGPPEMLRGALAIGLETGDALDERIEEGELTPWRVDGKPDELVPDDVLIVLADGRRVAVHRGRTRELAPREVWAPAASAHIARVVPDEDVTPAQLVDVLRRIGTQRVGLAAIGHEPVPTPLASVSIRAAVHRVTVVPVSLVLHPTPLPRGFGPCLDLRALPPDEPLEPHVREVRCVANAEVGEHAAPPPGRPPRPWLPSRPAWPPVVLLVLAIAIGCRWRGAARWRPGAVSLGVAVLTVATVVAGAALFRAATGA